MWLALFGAAGSADEPLRLRVMSYNIHHGEGVDRRLDLPRIADVIRAVQPDVVALQEVDVRAERTQRVDQAAELARLTEMQVVFGGNIPLQGGHYGNAVLSRHPIVRSKNHLLPRIGDSEQRGVLEVVIQPRRQPQPIVLWATHLDFRPDDRERLASVDMLNKLALQRPTEPALLCGDLNDTPTSKTLRELSRTWKAANEDPLPTIPVDQPNQQIDFILFRPSARWHVREVRVLAEVVASDHRPVFADLELRPAR